MGEAGLVVVDPARCTGCDLCRLACSFAREGRFDPRRARIAVRRENRAGLSLHLCRNCDEPPCLDACPAGAITRKDGRVVLQESKCRGCNMCVMVCPFNAIGWGGQSDYACDGCEGSHRCAQVCPMGAIRFTGVDAESRRRRRALAARLSKVFAGA